MPGIPTGIGSAVSWASTRARSNGNRAFAIFDRTIPVAFERGKNHNVDKAILVKRFIE